MTGNAISQGALGGNRVGVAQGVLAGQQQLAQAPVIAGLYNQGYNQAVSTAENQQQAGLAGAYGLSNIGNSIQNAGLTGANAQIGAGTLQQQTQQAQDTANYGQYAQAQAYPFQTSQWLAGIDSAIAPGFGSTSTGSTTAPPPNHAAQWAGAGLTAASLLLSDRDAKKNIHKIGSLNDGTPIYRYQYQGSDEWHVGPMAQDIEKRNPDAVHQGVGGFKYVDLKAATDDSIHKARGGPVAGLAVGGTPWSFAQGWVPTFGGAGGTAPARASAPGVQNPQTPNIDWSKIGNMTANPNGVFASNPAYGGDNMVTGAYGGSSSNPLPGLDASDYGPGFRRGGGVSGFAYGGTPDVMNGDPGWESPDVGPGYGSNMNDQFGAVSDAVANGTFDPQGINSTEFRGTPGIVASNAGTVPIPRPRPDAAPSDDEDDETPATATPTAGVAGGPAQPFNRDNAQAGFSSPTAAYSAPTDTGQPNKGLGIGFGLLSPNAQSGLLAAGLGMLSSRSPFLGNVIGEGGVAGLTAYGAAQEQDRKVADEARKLADAAKQHAEEMKLKQDTQGETVRHNKATEAIASDKAPSGYERQKDGSLAFIQGGPHDPNQISAETNARIKKGNELDDDTVDAIAQRVAQGDTRAIIGLGRNPTAIAQIQKRTAEIFKEQGLDHEAGAKAILGNIADQAGRMTAERTQAGIASKLAVYGRNVDNAIGVATKASEDVSRTGFVPVNKVLNAARTQTGDPKTVALGQALYTLINEYARAIGGGHGTVHDKEEAEQKLNQAYSHEQLVAIMGVMRQEIQMTKKSLPEAREEMRELYARPQSQPMAPGTVAPQTAAQPPATTFVPPQGALPRVYNGRTYYYDPATKQPYPGQ